MAKRVEYTVYEKKTGRVLVTGAELTAAELGEMNFDKYGVALGRFTGAYYFPEGRPALRPKSKVTMNKNEILADGSDSVIISKIPEGASIEIKEADEQGCQYTVCQNELIYTTRHPGMHMIDIQLFPFFDERLFVYARDASNQ